MYLGKRSNHRRKFTNDKISMDSLQANENDVGQQTQVKDNVIRKEDNEGLEFIQKFTRLTVEVDELKVEENLWVTNDKKIPDTHVSSSASIKLNKKN